MNDADAVQNIPYITKTTSSWVTAAEMRRNGLLCGVRENFYALFSWSGLLSTTWTV